MRALSEAVARCVRAQPPEHDEALMDKLASFLFTDTARDVVEAVRRGEDPVLSELDSVADVLSATDVTRPQYFHMLTTNGRSSWGGMVRYHDDIFPEGFYRTRALDDIPPAVLKKARYSADDASLLFEQPYFRWHGDRYDLELGSPKDNAALRIIDHLAATSGPRISLWRGTQAAYDSPEKLRRLGGDGRYIAGSMSRLGDDMASVMTTPDRAAAEQWANPALLQFSFTPAELKDLARQGLLYAGIEYQCLELALLYDRDPTSSRGRAALDRMTRIG